MPRFCLTSLLAAFGFPLPLWPCGCRAVWPCVRPCGHVACAHSECVHGHHSSSTAPVSAFCLALRHTPLRTVRCTTGHEIMQPRRFIAWQSQAEIAIPFAIRCDRGTHWASVVDGTEGAHADAKDARVVEAPPLVECGHRVHVRLVELEAVEIDVLREALGLG